jgi:hypothetical protein
VRQLTQAWTPEAIHRLVENLMRRIGNRRTRSSFAVICGSLGVVVIAAIFG